MSPGKGEELLAVLMHAQGRWTSVIYADMCCLGLGAQLMQHDGVKVAPLNVVPIGTTEHLRDSTPHWKDRCEAALCDGEK
jgi:hypothetical protein